MGHSTETSTFLSLDFTEILQLKYTLGLQIFKMKLCYLTITPSWAINVALLFFY